MTTNGKQPSVSTNSSALYGSKKTSVPGWSLNSILPTNFNQIPKDSLLMSRYPLERINSSGRSQSVSTAKQTIPSISSVVSISLSNQGGGSTLFDPTQGSREQMTESRLGNLTLELDAIYLETPSATPAHFEEQAETFRTKVANAIPSLFENDANPVPRPLSRLLRKRFFVPRCVTEYQRLCKEISIFFEYTVHYKTERKGELTWCMVKAEAFPSSEPHQFRLEVFKIANTSHYFGLSEILGHDVTGQDYSIFTKAIWKSYQSNADNLKHALETEAAKYKVVMYICPVEHVIKGDLVAKNPGNSTEMSKEVVVGKPTQGTAEDSIAE